MRGWRESLFWWGQAVSTCAVSHWAGMCWLYSPSPAHIVMFVQGCSCTLLQKTHWMYTPHPASKMTVLTKSCSTCAACEIQVTTLSSLPDTYFEACMACIYTCIYRICTYLSAATKERKRESLGHACASPCPDNANDVQDSRGWCLILCQACLCVWGGIVQPGFWGCTQAQTMVTHYSLKQAGWQHESVSIFHAHCKRGAKYKGGGEVKEKGERKWSRSAKK